jgi:DNA-binding response OmpR family regulator
VVSWCVQYKSVVGRQKVNALARIVVVEDDFDLSRVMRDMLADAGYEVISYMQPSLDVPEYLRMNHANLVIVDARLNNSVSGWDIIAALKQNPETENLPIIVCSGATEQIEAHCEELERYGIPALVKPFDLDELDALVHRMAPLEATASHE